MKGLRRDKGAHARESFGSIPVSSWKGPSPLAGHDKTARDVKADVGYEAKRFVAHHLGEQSAPRTNSAWDHKFTKWLLDFPSFNRSKQGEPPGAAQHAERQSYDGVANAGAYREFKDRDDGKRASPEQAAAALKNIKQLVGR